MTLKFPLQNIKLALLKRFPSRISYLSTGKTLSLFIRLRPLTKVLNPLLVTSVSDPHRFYADPDPDPAFLLNADPDPTCRM
jgi:hypothetical protein